MAIASPTTEADLFQGYRLDSLTLNATLAALDERSQRLTRERVALNDQPASQSREFALECNADAIRDTERARITFARLVPETKLAELPVEDPIDAYKAAADRGLSYHDVQAR